MRSTRPTMLAGAIEHAVDPIELACSSFSTETLTSRMQRERLLADPVDQDLGALEDPERVEQDDAEEQDEQAPESGQDDEGDVSAGAAASMSRLPYGDGRSTGAVGPSVIPSAASRLSLPGASDAPRLLALAGARSSASWNRAGRYSCSTRCPG